MIRTLSWIAGHGPACLIAGLLVGLLVPGLAQVLRPWIGECVALLLFVTGVRVGLRHAIGGIRDFKPTLTRIAVLQMGLPLCAIAVIGLLGGTHLPLALAVSLMLAAPSLTGAPNFAIMMGQDPAPGMRLLVLGTALFPLTALPVLVILDPTGGGALSAFALSSGLMGAIMAAVGLGFAVRHAWPALGSASAKSALDGVAALLLAIVVVGLMSAIGPLLRTDPGTLVLWMGAAIAINFGLVMATFSLCKWGGWKVPVATAIFAGNRNIALFLIVLPTDVAAPLMIFVGCYQIPMYLTPIFLSRLQVGPPP